MKTVVCRPVEGAQGKLDRRQPRADTKCVPRSDIRGVLGLEALDGCAHDEISALDRLAKAPLDLSGQRRMLCPQIDERHAHCRHRYFFNPRPRYTTGLTMLHQPVIGRILVYPSWCGG